VLGAGAVARAKEIRTPDWAPREFPISFWCGPPPQHVTREQYQRIRDAHFNYVMPSCSGGGDVESNRKVLDLAQEVGLKVFLQDGRMPGSASGEAAKKAIDAIVADYGKHKALAGYFLGDEPGAGAFPALGEVVAYLREKDPAHAAYLNLLPNYAGLDALGTPTYEAYVEQFIEKVRPPLVSYDHYHFTRGGDGAKFFSNLDAVRTVSRRHGLPFWQIVLLVQHGPYRPLTEAEKRYEAMQTLAYGGQGLMWFTYWQPDTSGMWGEAVINFDGSPTRQYEEVKRINADVQALGRELLHADCWSVFQTGTVPPGGTPPPEGSPLQLPDRPELTAGLFRKGDRSYALLANRDYRKATETEAVFTGAVRGLRRLSRADGRWSKVAESRVRNGVSTRVQLAPGDAELYRWQPERAS
jgi:hypothetical protein